MPVRSYISLGSNFATPFSKQIHAGSTFKTGLLLNSSSNCTNYSKSCRTISTSSSLKHYGGTWTISRRLQNPEVVRDMPTYEFVREDGKIKKRQMIYVCGFGATGSLGIPKYYRPDIKQPEELKKSSTCSSTFRHLYLPTSSGVINDIGCGYGFTMVACQADGTDHTVLAFGLNTHSQIGYHAPRPGYPLEIIATPSPVYLPTKGKVIKVACGRSHSLLLDNKGEVFSLGNNSLGQCGRPIDEDEIYHGSKRIHSLRGDLPSNIIKLECGQDHSMFLAEDGKLFSCGWGADGQTGLGHYDNQIKPCQVKGDLDGAKIVKVSCYADTVLALDDEGNVYGWGNTEYSQFRVLADCETEQFNCPRRLKLKKALGRIVDIAAGGTICALLNDKGQVFVWGFGILGKGPGVDQSSWPSLIPETLFGMNVYNPDVKIEKIYASLSHFAAISNQGDLYTWGKNRGQALGFAHGRDQLFPMRVNTNLAKVKHVALGVDHTCAITEKVC